MKKSLILVGLLSIGYAHAQQYDGKVGVNTETPSATLNVKSKTGKDATTKNLELVNASNTKLVTVLDNGHFGILAEPLEDVFNIQNLLRFNYWGRSLGLGISATPHSQWARGYNFSTSDGTTNFGGFGGFGLPNSLKYFYIGKDYTNTIAKFDTDTGNVGIGINTFTNNPTHKLHIKSEADPLRLEGLQNATGNGNQALVVDANGVVKIGAASAGLAQEVDGVIGNEIKDVITDGGLRVDGDGTSTSPLKVGIKEGGVTGTMLANGSVTGEKLAPSSVDAGKIAPNAVTGDKIANATIGADKLNIPGQADQVLTYKGGKWVAADAKGLTAGINKGDMLVWNGTSWVTKSYKVVRTAETSYTVTDEDLVVSTTSQADFAITLPTTDEYRYKGRKVCFFVKDPNTTGNFSPSITGGYNFVNGTSSNCVLWDGEEWIPVVGG